MPVWSCEIIQVCEMPLPYLTGSMRTVLLLYNQSVVMLLYLINSVGPQIAKKLLRLTYQSTMAMTLKCYPGELKIDEVYHVHLICMCFWFYTFHFRADNAVTAVYKPPNTTLFGKALEMKLKVASGRTQWFKGQISNYDGLTGKYRINFPCDGETVYVYSNNKDMRFVC